MGNETGLMESDWIACSGIDSGVGDMQEGEGTGSS